MSYRKAVLVLSLLQIAMGKGDEVFAAMQWKTEDGGNGHWYDVFNGPISWDEAKVAAESSELLGVQGHLATITSAEENLWITTSFTQGNRLFGGYQLPSTQQADEGWRAS